MMDIEEAYYFCTSNSGKGFRDISRLFNWKYHLEEVKHDYLRKIIGDEERERE